MAFKIGLIVNPFAGLGGSVALKGSDNVAKDALAKGAIPQAGKRCLTALEALHGLDVELFTYANDMGEDCAQASGLAYQVIGAAQHTPSQFEDTMAAAQQMASLGVDVIMFAGGDGTARDMLKALEASGMQVPVVGIPAGVKIHSGVYGINPKAAGQVVAKLVTGQLVSLRSHEVRDIDEEAFRQGQVKARYFGEMLVPEEHQYMQATKSSSGKEDEQMVLLDIADWVAENMVDDVRYIMGSGSTVAAIMERLELDNTLLGVDVIENGELLASDVTAEQLLALTEGYDCQLYITLIGGQGHVFGRGNQQLSPALIRQLGMDNIHIVATKTKLNALDGKPLLVDTGDSQLDDDITGVVPVLCGYNDQLLYPIGNPNG
jgi:predicted polyphosphate/ATP-dependent NAD kinase